jgi:nitrate/nitrite transporter NarK
MPTNAPTTIRYRVVAVTALMAILLYLDRFCISFAEIYIKEDLHLSDTQIGWVLSAFFWTYALAQVPSGWLTDRFGGRVMLTIYVLLWSLFTGLTGAAIGFISLIALRLGFGVAQAGAYPTSAALVSRWIPLSARGTASSLIAFGGRMGGALAPVLTGLLIVLYVPISTSSHIEPDDLLNVPRLCYELEHGKATDEEDPARRLSERVISLLPSPSPRVVQENAERFADDETAEASDDDTALLAGELSNLLSQRDLFDDAMVRELALPSEAKGLLDREQSNLSDDEIERLNRLILEAAYRESIRKVYVGGWRQVMVVYGLCGIFVALAVWWVLRRRPEEHAGCNDAERELIAHGRPPETSGEQLGAAPLLPLVKSRSMWLMCLTQWCTNVGWVFLVTWLPRYLIDVYNVPIEQRAVMTFTPIAVGWLGMLAGGQLTDRLVRRFGLRWGRALPISFSRFLAMGAYLTALLISNFGDDSLTTAWVVVIAFSFVAFSTDLGTGSIWAVLQDVGGRHVGSTLGWANMWGNLGAAVTPIVLIWIVGEEKNWNLALLTCATAFLIAGLAALGINAEERIGEE